jgi:hypothetical protein
VYFSRVFLYPAVKGAPLLTTIYEVSRKLCSEYTSFQDFSRASPFAPAFLFLFLVCRCALGCRLVLWLVFFFPFVIFFLPNRPFLRMAVALGGPGKFASTHPLNAFLRVDFFYKLYSAKTK